jgi:hypothetical protein
LLNLAADHGMLSPIGNCTKLQRLSIFADDMVHFVNPLTPDLVVVRRELLNLFGQAYGLHVIYRMMIATLVRGGEHEEIVANHRTIRLLLSPSDTWGYTYHHAHSPRHNGSRRSTTK